MCFLIGATGKGVTATGEALIGGVSDDPYLFRTFVRAMRPRRGMAHLGSELRYVTDPRWAPEGVAKLPPPFDVEPGQPSRGINAAGVAFTCALAVECGAPPVAPPRSFAMLCARMMAECSTADEAVALLSAAPAVSPAFSVLIADAQGVLVHVEVGSFGVVVHRRCSKEEPGVVVAVNCYQSGQLRCFNREDAQLEHEANNNGVRLRRGRELGDGWRGRLSVRGLAEILSDHRSDDRDCASNPLIPFWGHSICNHGTCGRPCYDPRSPPWGTVSAEIMQPESRAFHYCYGWPCGASPMRGDQLLQDGSWGRFEPFVFPRYMVSAGEAGGDKKEAGVVQYTSVDGSLTPDGEAHRLYAVRQAGA